MKPAVLDYPRSDNLGDYVQTIAAKMMLSEVPISIDREKLNSYSETPVCLIMNGWFMENPKNWPPSTRITPLFVSFHINPTVAKQMTSTASIAYMKRYEPIGCRDLYTTELLISKGIKAYFSGCLTLTLKRDFFLKDTNQPKSILVISVLERLNPKRVKWKNNGNLVHLGSQLLKYPFKNIKYQRAMRRVNRFLMTQPESVIKRSQIISNPNISPAQKETLAMEQLQAIASAKLVITSRIHSALPAIAMGIPVLFLSDGLSHINQSSRIKGLESFLRMEKTKGLKNLKLEHIPKPKIGKEIVATLEKVVRTKFQ